MPRVVGCSRRWRSLALLLIVGSALALAPVAAQEPDQQANVTVEAEITIPIELSMSLCDTDADFGTGLTHEGALPTGTNDSISATSPGSPDNGQGVYYIWEPSCQAAETGFFVTVNSNVPWTLTTCASQGASSSTLTIADNDLRFGESKAESYLMANNATPFPTCSAPAVVRTWSAPGTLRSLYHLYLQVDPNDDPGTFAATTTWTVSP